MIRWSVLGGLLILFAGVGALAAWGIPELLNNDESNSVSREFCDSVSAWHGPQVAFSRRVNAPGAQRGGGLDETFDVFYKAAEISLPHAQSDREDELRALLREVVRIEETWLSELSTANAIDEVEPPVSEEVVRQYFAVRDKAEAERIALNDLLREANALLPECGLDPLPIYG
ncbi:MAG: hypothetical protein WD379_00990 [Dehalococcoidia bacterium]